MNFAPRYLGRGSWLAQRDPRLLVIAIVCFVLAAIQIWDVRLMIGMLVLGLAWFRSAHIPFAAVRRQWLFALSFVSLIVVFNLIVASGRVQRLPPGGVEHIYGHLPVLGTPISAESVTYAI